MAKKLEQTKGTFRLKGLVKGMERDNAYEEGIRTDNSRNSGRTYRKLNIGIQTDPNNQVRLGLYAYEPEEVFMWNSEKRKQQGEKYKGDRIPWEQYLEQKDILKANGNAVLQARAGVTYDENDKLVSEGMTNYEFAEMIADHVNNDDSVYVEGDISHSKYKTDNNEERTAVNYNLNRLHLAGQEFDFEDEEYEVQNYYEQEFVFVNSMIDKENEKLIVIGRTIDWNQNTVDADFVVNYGDDEDLKKLANSLHKKFKFGDLVKVFGELRNESVETEVEEESFDDGLASLGGKAQPSYVKRANVTYIREMTILGVLDWKKKYYTEEDFFENELVVEEEESELDSLGGKTKPENDNPFADDEIDPFSDSEENDPFSDIPF